MAPKSKQRIDLVLVHRGLAENLSQAQAILMARQVTVNGQPIGKPGFVIDVDADVDIVRTPQYVGRGGIKLASAIAAFGIDVCGVAALDIGAST
ncbi:S4 domain-containing protein, partial [Dehalococcoidia bacterium]|nr:S4 domain-containing protein [Dehalococcoidia bacterium]